MDNLIRQVLTEIVFVSPVVLTIIVIVVKRRALRASSRLPFRELRRRPAGESLRLRLESFEEKIGEWMMYLIALPAAAGGIVGLTRQPGIAALVLFALSSVWAAGCGWKLYRLVRERANYQLGFDGERFVGEELSRLGARGFDVYHDLPFDGFNIDHVVVGPSGVFVIETKTRRKPVNDSRDKEYRVEFDGFRLHWPTGSVDTYGIDQAANNARTLMEWLSGAVGEPVSTIAILTLPGWMVDRKAPPKAVHVLNPKEIFQVCDSKRQALDDNLLKRIRYQLDQRCKLGVE